MAEMLNGQEEKVGVGVGRSEGFDMDFICFWSHIRATLKVRYGYLNPDFSLEKMGAPRSAAPPGVGVPPFSVGNHPGVGVGSGIPQTSAWALVYHERNVVLTVHKRFVLTCMARCGPLWSSDIVNSPTKRRAPARPNHGVCQVAKTQTTPTPVATVAVTEPSPPAPVVVNLSGVYAVPITKIDGETVTVRAGDMTQETLANVFAHGLKQLVNDATSAFKAKEDIRKAARAMAERISTNQWSPGKGGGHKLSPFEVELRNVAEMQLRLVCNRTGADAKVVKVGDAARDVAVTMLARKNGGDPSTVTVEMEKPVIEKLMEAWTKVARANLETAAALTIEI